MEIHHHLHLDEQFKEEIRDNFRKLFYILKKYSMDLSALQAAVSQETTIDLSVQSLLTTLAAELATANANNDQAAIDAIVKTMNDNAASLGAAVAANTPAAPVVAGS